MPVIRQQLSIAARGIKAFLNLEAGVTRVNSVPAPKPRPNKGIMAREASVRPAAQRRGEVKPDNIVWLFGTGRSGSTWLSSMMGDLTGQTLWGEPWVGALFGNFYYSTDERKHRVPQFVLGPYRKEPIRSFTLEAAAVTFPKLRRNDYLIIKEPNGSIGAPLLMEALPESRMVLLVRDPRDVVASSLDARREGGWHYEKNRDRLHRDRREPPRRGSIEFAEERAKNYLQGMGNAKTAYDAHKGRKALVRYEDLRADTLGTMRHMYSKLDVPADEKELAQIVEKYSWENIPEDKKGEGKFYRKGQPGGWREDLTHEQVKVIDRITSSLVEDLYPEKV